jgi:hypothetical protein
MTDRKFRDQSSLFRSLWLGPLDKMGIRCDQVDKMGATVAMMMWLVSDVTKSTKCDQL